MKDIINILIACIVLIYSIFLIETNTSYPLGYVVPEQGVILKQIK